VIVEKLRQLHASPPHTRACSDDDPNRFDCCGGVVPWAVVGVMHPPEWERRSSLVL